MEQPAQLDIIINPRPLDLARLRVRRIEAMMAHRTKKRKEREQTTKRPPKRTGKLESALNALPREIAERLKAMM
jgi:hypothetical protein